MSSIPGIFISTFCIIQHSNSQFKIFNFISDTDLHNVVKRGNILKDIHKRYIMYQLFKGMHYMHSGNVIHRDQKVSFFPLLNQSSVSEQFSNLLYFSSHDFPVGFST